MNKVNQFWEDRSKLGEKSGSNDFLLKSLEQQLILDIISPDSSVLEIGCGNGDTLIKLAEKNNCTGIGFDYTEGMINSATSASLERGTSSKVTFKTGKIPGLPSEVGQFDYVLTERCLINLDSHESQHKAFLEIMNHVKVGGYYLMIESFIQGLDRTNDLRARLNLERINPPWHNVFMDENLVAKWESDAHYLEKIVPFSSTYFFLSRVVYAALAQQTGEELRYDSEINLLSCQLPPIGDFGPARLYLWKRLS